MITNTEVEKRKEMVDGLLFRVKEKQRHRELLPTYVFSPPIIYECPLHTLKRIQVTSPEDDSFHHTSKFALVNDGDVLPSTGGLPVLRFRFNEFVVLSVDVGRFVRVQDRPREWYQWRGVSVPYTLGQTTTTTTQTLYSGPSWEESSGILCLPGEPEEKDGRFRSNVTRPDLLTFL